MPKGRKRQRVRDAPARGRLWEHSTLADVEGLVDPGAGIHLGFSLCHSPHENRSGHGDWRAAYGDKRAALLARLADEDITRFCYRFDPD